MPPPAVKHFTVPPERYISAPTWELLEHCKGLMSGQDGDVLSEFAQLVEGTSQFEFLALRRRIKRNFEIFALASQGKKPMRRSPAHPSEERLDREELRFMEDLVDLLEACHFRLLSAEDWATAQAEEFTFTMPVEVNWQFMNKGLMSRFWQHRGPLDHADKASMADRILVFHRGITSMRAQGKFYVDKVDLLVSYLIMQPLTGIWDAFAPEKLKAMAPRLTVDVNEHMQASDLAGHHGHDADVPKDLHRGDPSLGHAHAKEVRRVTLKALMPTTKAVFNQLFTTLTIEEPGFQDVVILYRRNIPDKPQPKNEKSPMRDEDPRLAQRNIHVKRFSSIPMADAEMIFPDKRVYVKPLTLITLFITIVMGIVACLTTFMTSEFSMGTFLSVLGIFGGRAYQVYFSATIARQQVVDQIMKTLYEQTMDAQEGVIYYLLDQMADQHIKEVLVAYFILLSSGKSMSQDRLDQACEEHLAAHFGQEVDFAIERSLPELLDVGLVTVNDGLLTAVPLAEGHKKLKGKWEKAYQVGQQQHYLAISGHAPDDSSYYSGRDSRVQRLSDHARKSFRKPATSRNPSQTSQGASQDPSRGAAAATGPGPMVLDRQYNRPGQGQSSGQYTEMTQQPRAPAATGNASDAALMEQYGAAPGGSTSQGIPQGAGSQGVPQGDSGGIPQGGSGSGGIPQGDTGSGRPQGGEETEGHYIKGPKGEYLNWVGPRPDQASDSTKPHKSVGAKIKGVFSHGAKHE